MQVKDVMVYGAVMIEPTASVADAAALMAREDVGMLIVGTGEIAEGVITDRDLLVRCVGAGEMPDSRLVSEFVSAPAQTIDPDADVVEASKLMREKSLRRLAVARDKKLIGVVSHTDIIQSFGQVMYDLMYGAGSIRQMPAAALAGSVTHYFNHSGVAVVDLTAPVHKGDSVHIVGNTTDFGQEITSMEIDHKPVTAAFPGDDLAIKVKSRVRTGDRLYRLQGS
jgi:CBS domain-containing protein